MENRIKNKLPAMSKGQKKISNYILTSFDKAAFMTAAELGKNVGVSESTVVRYAAMLGYKGYPEFQKDVEKMVQRKLDTIHRFEINDTDMSGKDLLDSVMKSDIDKIRLSLEMIDIEIFDEAVDSILKADTIYLVGIRNCAPLASFLGFYFNLMFDKVNIITTNSSSEIFEQMIRISEKDVIIGISFPRYSMRTLKAMEFANNRNAKVITITDSKNSPMNLYSSCNLFARSELTAVIDSLTAPMSVINALIVALSMKRKEKVINTLDTLEQIWNDYQVYGSDEINIFDDTVDITEGLADE
ncbi:MAG: MurR/RpiR family transcriptional regulator [Lachnospiraceae bacterium]|nr:MurR/RpiR family transcriptional regulator [Lachnospiraceae bacterium]MDE6254095.1 MurR/RpiR family transcriptional regulator [Lachnospiraceae bacterium]